MGSDPIVIVGAGHAGVQAAASLREEGCAGGLMLVSDETTLPYQRPPSSKAFMKKAAAAPDLLLRDIADAIRLRDRLRDAREIVIVARVSSAWNSPRRRPPEVSGVMWSKPRRGSWPEPCRSRCPCSSTGPRGG